MSAVPPDIDGHLLASPDEPGYTDDAFVARYDGKRSHATGSRAAARRPPIPMLI